MGGVGAVTAQIDLHVYVEMEKTDTLKLVEIKDERLKPGKYQIEGWYGAVGIAPLDNEDIKNQDCNWIVSLTKSAMYDKGHKFSREFLPLPRSRNFLLYREQIWAASSDSRGKVVQTQSQGMPFGMFPRPIEAEFERLYLALTTNAFHTPNNASVCILLRKMGE